METIQNVPYKLLREAKFTSKSPDGILPLKVSIYEFNPFENKVFGYVVSTEYQDYQGLWKEDNFTDYDVLLDAENQFNHLVAIWKNGYLKTE